MLASDPKAEFQDGSTDEPERMRVVVELSGDAAGILFGKLDSASPLGADFRLAKGCRRVGTLSNVLREHIQTGGKVWEEAPGESSFAANKHPKLS